MKKILILLLITLPIVGFGQVGVALHHSNLPFLGVNLEIKDRFRPEVRVGVDQYFDDISLEGVVTYDLINKVEYEVYAGLGGRFNDFSGLVIPIGLNVYPLPLKQFGFHIELAPIISDRSLLRGSWGIRYRFDKD